MVNFILLSSIRNLLQVSEQKLKFCMQFNTTHCQICKTYKIKLTKNNIQIEGSVSIKLYNLSITYVNLGLLSHFSRLENQIQQNKN